MLTINDLAPWEVEELERIRPGITKGVRYIYHKPRTENGPKPKAQIMRECRARRKLNDLVLKNLFKH